MRKIIHNLRKQPEEVRTHLLHVFTLVAGVILVSLWVFGLGQTVANEETQAKVENDLAPFSALKANLIGGYKSITEPTPAVIE